MVNILIVGGSKFIGKHLLQKLGDQSHEITVINRGNIDSSAYLPKDAEHHKVDRNNVEQLSRALSGKKFDLVYDICAITGDHDLTVNFLIN